MAHVRFGSLADIAASTAERLLYSRKRTSAAPLGMPIATAAKPTIRFGPIPSPTTSAPTIDANTGFTVIVTAVLVGLDTACFWLELQSRAASTACFRT